MNERAASERVTRAERAGAAARERACRGVRRGEAPRLKMMGTLTRIAPQLQINVDKAS